MEVPLTLSWSNNQRDTLIRPPNSHVLATSPGSQILDHSPVISALLASCHSALCPRAEYPTVRLKTDFTAHPLPLSEETATWSCKELIKVIELNEVLRRFVKI